MNGRKTRKVKLVVNVELDVYEDVPDEAVYQAICNQFVGSHGGGLEMWPTDSTENPVAPKHNITVDHVHEDHPQHIRLGVWGSTL